MTVTELTESEALLLVSTLLSVKVELEELIKEKEWYVTDLMDMIETCLEILGEKD